MSAAPGTGRPDSLPAGRQGWRLAPGVLRLGPGRFAGGSPLRVVRLTPAGDEALGKLLGSADQPSAGTPAGTLAQRLCGYGMLLAPPRGTAPVKDITVVIPARSGPARVAALLSAVPPGVPTVLVDDGSPSELAAWLPARAGLTHLRHRSAQGPAAARNAGARLARTRWIVFLDADVVPPPEWLGRLAGYLPADPPGPGPTAPIVALAPRILSSASAGLGGLVERYCGALDLGPTAADVAPRAPVSYVPSAVLLVDRAAFWRAGGFDPGLRVAEDVDLVWRLRGEGRIRYQPDIVVWHQPRGSLGQVLRRRYFYGTGAVALEQRHPGLLRHADVSGWSFAPWLLAIGVHPALGVLAGVIAVVGAPRQLRRLAAGDAIRLAVHGQLLASGALGRWLVRPLWPLTALLALGWPRGRRRLAAAVAAGLLEVGRATLRGDLPGEQHDHGIRRLAGALLARMLADGAYSLGVWDGCLRSGSWAVLAPRLRPSGSGER